MEVQQSNAPWNEEEIGAVMKLPIDRVTEVIDRCTLRDTRDVVSLLSGIFKACPTDDLALCVFKHCIGLLASSDLPNKVGSQLNGVLMMQADSLPTESQIALVSLFVTMVKDGSVGNSRCLELLSKLLSTVTTKDVVSHAGNSVSGKQYASQILNTLCSCKWSPQSVIHLVATFRDISMSNDELGFVVNKAVRSFKTLDYTELPPVVYQLLLLSTKGHKRSVLEGICVFFTEQDESCKADSDESNGGDLIEVLDEGGTVEQLRHTEGTVLLHITFAIKQDQDLGREFIKYMKCLMQSSPCQLLSPFNFALALSVGSIHCFEEQIFDLLKSATHKSYKDQLKQCESAWLSDILPSGGAASTGPLLTVANSKFGWDHVLRGLVQFGFTLMESFGPKSFFGKSVEGLTPCTQQSATQQACQLGSDVLLETFKIHDSVRTEIIEQIMNRVVTKTTSRVGHYLDLLSSAMMCVPQSLLDCVPRIRQAFDYLSHLPPSTSESLIEAILPLMKVNASLRDSLLLVLRKAMFSRQIEARQVALSGFLLILKHFRVVGAASLSQASQCTSSSQIAVDIHSQTSSSSNEALCLEILANLRRPLSQQADLRCRLYEGLFDIVSRNTQLCQPVLQLLLSQFERYYEKDDSVTPPVKLERCVATEGEKVIVVEPLAHLLQCTVQCLVKGQEVRDQDEEEGTEFNGCLTELENILESLTRRMAKCEMEDFELDKSAEFSTGKPVGVRNNIFASIVCGLQEMLIEYSYHTGKLRQENCEQIVKLYKNYQALADVICERATSGSGALAANKLPRTMLSFKFAVGLLDALVCDTLPCNQAGLSLLRDEPGFARYIALMCVQKLCQIDDSGSCDGIQGKQPTKLFIHVSTVARVFLHAYCTNCSVLHDPSQVRQMTSTCLEGITKAITVLCTRYPQQKEQFLLTLADACSTEAVPAVTDPVQQVINKFQKLVISNFSGDKEDRKIKDVSALMACLSMLSRLLPSKSHELKQLHDWLKQLATERAVGDISAARAISQLLIETASRTENVVMILRDFAQDLHSQMGDIDEEVEVEDRTNFAMVTTGSTCNAVLHQVLLQLDKEVDSVDWVINKMKSDQGSSKDTSTQQMSQRDSQVNCVSTRLATIVTTLFELTQTAVSVGTCAEQLFKTLIKLYATLSSLTKFYLSLYSQERGHLSSRFEKLVKISSTHLTQPVYALITYIQASQNEKLASAVGKKGKAKTAGIIGERGKARILKETRLIPNLVFSIEQYERYLIQLSKKSKVNLMEHVKLSTSRDFRINVASMQASLTYSSEEEEEDASKLTTKSSCSTAKKSKSVTD